MEDLHAGTDESEITAHFRVAAKKILTFLHKRLGFQLWAVTRSYNDHWIMLVTEDNGYNVKDGDVFVWSDSFCSRMVHAKGPQITPKVKDVPEYMSAPIGKEYPTSSYIGIPLKQEDGTLFGTLCAIDPAEKPDSIVNEAPLIHLFAELLSQLIDADMKTQKFMSDIELVKLKTELDPDTGLYNSNAWDIYIAKEQKRCDTFGSPALILLIKLDHTVDSTEEADHLKKIAAYIKNIFRASDIVAYLGGNTYAVLAVEIDSLLIKEFISRIQQSFIAKNISASMGWAEHDPEKKLTETQLRAENNLKPL